MLHHLNNFLGPWSTYQVSTVVYISYNSTGIYVYHLPVKTNSIISVLFPDIKMLFYMPAPLDRQVAYI